MVRGVRAVDSRCEWLKHQREKRVDRGEELDAIVSCLQQRAELCLCEQRQLLREAVSRRGLRALRSPCDGKGETVRQTTW